MTNELSGRIVLVPGGTGAVGEGIVRRFLMAGAQVVVPTRSQTRADEFRRLLGDAASTDLHLFAHDYTTFRGAEELATTAVAQLGSIDHVVAPIGGWWSGKPLWEIDEPDWRSAFVDLAGTHVAVMRATVPLLPQHGSYSLVLGASAFTPIPGSGLVSMEQAALLMMRQVLAVEAGDRKRLFALTLGQVRTRLTDGDPDLVSADQVGAVAAAIAASSIAGQEVRLRNQAEFMHALELLQAATVTARTS